MPSPHPLSGLRVVEIGDRLAASYAGKLLRDAGADVVKVESGSGDGLRSRQPAFFAFLNGGKRSVVADRGAVSAIARNADAVLLAASPEEARRIGFDTAELLAAAPGCALVTVSNFGWTGGWAEYPATEFTLQAWCGSTGSRGVPERPPIAAAGDLGEFIAGGYAAFFALAAHYGRAGGHYDLSVLEAMCTSMQTFGWLRRDVSALTAFSRSTEVPSVERAKDGYVGVSMATDTQWESFCEMVGCPELATEPGLALQINRWKQRDRIRAAIGPWFAGHTVSEIVELAETHRVPMAAIGNGATLPQMDHFVARGTFVDNPAGFRQPRTPWLMSESAPNPVAAPPALGEAGAAPDDLWPARQPPVAGGDSGSPLRGLRIVDLTAFWAGPAATQLFAMLGADVVKVESCQHPDGMRYSGTMRSGVEDWWEYSWVFHAVNTNKWSVTLNLQSPRGRELLGRLIGQADMVVENFPARVMEQLGLDFDTLRGFNPSVIVVRMPAFGLDGPWRNRGGFAMTMEQIAGLAWLTGYDDDVPTAPRGPCDALAAVHAAFAALCAAQFRRRTGHGQLVEVPMIETVLNATARQVIEYDVDQTLLTRCGNRGHDHAVQNVYACAGVEQWIAVSVRDDTDRAALATVVGQTSIDDAGLAEWFRDKPLAPTVQALLDAGVPAAPVVLPTDIGDNPQLQARRFLETVSHPRCGPVRYPRPPIAAPPGRAGFVDLPAPMLGEHNRDVLGGLLGLTADELAQLERDAVIGSVPIR